MTYNFEKSNISEIFRMLESRNELDLTKNIDNILANVYGLIQLFLGDELTVQERQAWFYIAKIFPKPSTGIELARQIGSSETSKTIYKSIENLKKKRLIVVNQLHPRVFSIQANEKHPLTNLLIDFGNYYDKQI
ncbi:MAG: hypothetical protein HeimC3_10850 [Candidatus Heimdallarchaeota archaeon LC_3]|nr:MAG: hypothetical protein HeimC3_10850 [Candidatus Heimdallarchaeota archaeon LC_3]